MTARHRFPDLVRAVVDGLGMAMRDYYSEMGALPKEVSLSGGVVRSASIKQILGASINANVRMFTHEETGAAGATTMSAVAIGAFDNMEPCIRTWVSPLLSDKEEPEAKLAGYYYQVYDVFDAARGQMEGMWEKMDRLHCSPNRLFEKNQSDTTLSKSFFK